MIKPLKEVLDRTLSTVKKYQKGELQQIKTNRPWFDHQGGVVPKSIITIAAASFGGKSTELENLKADIMNVDINPSANNYVWLSNSFEMTNFATTLRDIKKITNKSFKDILSNEFNDQERDLVNKYYVGKTDGRFYVNQVPQTAKEFVSSVRNFLQEHIDKELVVLDIDHMGLIRASSDGKKLAIDDVVEGLNELKNEFDNFLIVILTQLNRSILGRLKDKSNDSAIRRDDIFQSDTIYHISDYVIGLQNANYLHIEQYRKINPDKYPHLEHRFGDMDSKGKVSLYTAGCIFVEVLKDRTADIGYVDLYTIEITPFDKKVVIKENNVKIEEAPSFDPPTVDMTINSLNSSSARGEGFDNDNDPPF